MNAHEPGSSATVSRYLAAFYSGDFATARSVLADGFSFHGPFVQATGADAFFAAAEGLRSLVRGHRLLRQVCDGEEVCSLYEVDLETPTGAGSVPMSEWHVVRDGRIASGRVLFDTAAFRTIVSGGSDGGP